VVDTFEEALSKSPHRDAVLTTPNPGLILALQGSNPGCPLFNGPVRVTTKREVKQVKSANQKRLLANLPPILFVKEIPSVDPVVSISQGNVFGPTVAALPSNSDAVSNGPEVIDVDSLRLIMGEDLDRMMNEVDATPAMYGLRSNENFHKSLQKFHQVFKNGDFLAYNTELCDSAMDIWKEAQLISVVTPDNSSLGVTDEVRQSWAKLLFAYGNNNSTGVKLHLHHIIFLVGSALNFHT
jgi:hypothetical protein